MPTHLPQNQFITNSAPARTSPDADTAAAYAPPPLEAAAGPFANSAMPTAESAVAFKAPPVADATAAPFDFDWRAFWDFITDDRIVLFDLHNEIPMFIREDGYLRRNA